MIQILTRGTWIEHRPLGFGRGRNALRGTDHPEPKKERAGAQRHKSKRIVEAINEYRELVQQSMDMRDQLEPLQTRWSSLRQERDQLRLARLGCRDAR